jgi:hypothetical protein
MDQGRQDGLKRDIPGATIDARVVRRLKEAITRLENPTTDGCFLSREPW